MYKEHPEFFTPPEDLFLWRYLDFTKFMSLLETSTLYFTRADKFSDVFEGAYPEKSIQKFRDYYFVEMSRNKHAPQRIEETFNALLKSCTLARESMLINCWHMNQYESAAMWGLYLKGNEGIAIKSNSSRLKDSLHIADETVHIGSVNYLNYDENVIHFENIFSPFLCKRNSFEHEREVRAVIWKPAIKDGVIDHAESKVSHGLNVKCDLQILVDSIYVAPNAPVWFTQLIHDVLRRYGFDWEVNQSKLNDKPFVIP